MADLFNWLNGGSWLSIIIIVVVFVVICICILEFVVGFFQGREISFWPLRIGKKPNETRTPVAKQVLDAFRGVAKVPLVTRDQLDQLTGTVQQRLSKAKDEIKVSGNDNKFIAESGSSWIEDALRRGVRIKIVCVDPKSPATDMLPKIDPRFPTASTFVESMVSVEKVLRRLRKEFPRHFEFRYLPLLPRIGLFITDPVSPSGIIKVEFYVSKPYKHIDSRPHIIIPPDLADWRRYFLAQWDNYWQISQERE